MNIPPNNFPWAGFRAFETVFQTCESNVNKITVILEFFCALRDLREFSVTHESHSWPNGEKFSCPKINCNLLEKKSFFYPCYIGLKPVFTFSAPLNSLQIPISERLKTTLMIEVVWRILLQIISRCTSLSTNCKISLLRAEHNSLKVKGMKNGFFSWIDYKIWMTSNVFSKDFFYFIEQTSSIIASLVPSLSLYFLLTSFICQNVHCCVARRSQPNKM